MYEYKQFYRRKLPHRHSPGATLFITFRLAGSIPKTVINKYKNEKIWLENEARKVQKLEQTAAGLATSDRKERFREFYRNWFRNFEDILHKEVSGPVWLRNPEVTDLIAESLKHRDGDDYRLRAYCIMSNHAHIVITPLLSEASLKETRDELGRVQFVSTAPTLGAIMRSLKGYTARRANRILNREGQFWESESYDHEVRNEAELQRIVRYVLNNPVKANLVKNWQEWKWTWWEGNS